MLKQYLILSLLLTIPCAYAMENDSDSFDIDQYNREAEVLEDDLYELLQSILATSSQVESNSGIVPHELEISSNNESDYARILRENEQLKTQLAVCKEVLLSTTLDKISVEKKEASTQTEEKYFKNNRQLVESSSEDHLPTINSLLNAGMAHITKQAAAIATESKKNKENMYKQLQQGTTVKSSAKNEGTKKTPKKLFWNLGDAGTHMDVLLESLRRSKKLPKGGLGDEKKLRQILKRAKRTKEILGYEESVPTKKKKTN